MVIGMCPHLPSHSQLYKAKLRLVKSWALYTRMVPERIVARLDNQGQFSLDLR